MLEGACIAVYLAISRYIYFVEAVHIAGDSEGPKAGEKKEPEHDVDAFGTVSLDPNDPNDAPSHYEEKSKSAHHNDVNVHGVVLQERISDSADSSR